MSPSVAFVGPSAEAGEGAGAAAGAVRLTTPDELPTTAPVTVKFTTANLTALAGADYAATVGTLSFPTGTATGAILNATVPLKDDVLSEDDETFKLTLSAPTGARLGPQGTTTMKILDDDPLPGVSIADATLTEPNAGLGSMTFTLSLSAPAGRVVSVSYATADGSAVAPADYKAKSGSVSFPAGKTSAVLSVSVVGDTVDEENEAFLVTLVSPVKAVLDRTTAQGVILDNDGLSSFCQPIVTVPYEITSSGRYCLGRDLTFEAAEGAAITVSADFVSVDLRGFGLSGTAGLETQARGIFATGRQGLLVLNGRVSGFLYGVQLDDTYPYPSGGHRVERIRAEGNTVAGIYVAGRNDVVRLCVVLGTGGLNEEGETGTETFGIAVLGPDAQALDNDVSDTRGNGSAGGRSLFVRHGQGTVVMRNRLVGENGATGLWVRESQDVLAVRNRFTGLGEGIVFEGESSGAYRSNLTSGVVVPYTGGTDAGGNE